MKLKVSGINFEELNLGIGSFMTSIIYGGWSLKSIHIVVKLCEK